MFHLKLPFHSEFPKHCTFFGKNLSKYKVVVFIPTFFPNIVDLLIAFLISFLLLIVPFLSKKGDKWVKTT